jgi:tRNA dimethylallyltransferase
MIKNNCIYEVKNFLKLKIDPTLSANKIIGVQEIKAYLEKKLDLNEVTELIDIKTRQYAKRQVTWSRGHMADWKREYSNSFRELSKKILKHLS